MAGIGACVTDTKWKRVSLVVFLRTTSVLLAAALLSVDIKAVSVLSYDGQTFAKPITNFGDGV